HRHPQGAEPLKGVSGAVSHRQDAGRHVDTPALAPFLIDKAAQNSLLNVKIRYMALKMHLSAGLADLFPQTANHPAQTVRTDMGAAVVENGRVGSAFCKNGEHPANAAGRVLDHGVQFAVGESAGSALAKLDVGFRI